MEQARRDWDHAHPDYIRERRREHRERLAAYKADRGCVDCGTKTGRLDFDHRPGEEKVFSIAHAKNRSWEAIMAEAEKCDIRCASCHSRRHVLAGDTLHKVGV